MDWKKLACCVALGGALTACGGGTTLPDAPPQTRRYVLSAIRIPEPMGTSAVGFNLDGMNSTGDGTTCVELSPDYTSINDAPETGVDNALGSLVPQLGMLLGDSCPMGTPAADCLSALIGQQITEGKLLIVMEVRDINSFVTDSSIEVQLSLGTVPGGGAPMLAGSTLAPDQAFDVMAVGTPVTGAITAGRMAVTTPLLTISIVTDSLTLDLNIRNAQVRGTFGPMGNGIVNGAIGGSLRVSDIAMAAESIMPGLSATVMSVLGGIADMEPQSADPTTCDSLSVGIAFDGVNAANAPGTASGT